MSENDIANKIRILRAQHNLTLEDVAIEVGVGKSTVRKWEVGQIANMRRDKIAKLASALHTTPAYLMGWEEDIPLPDSEEFDDWNSRFRSRLIYLVQNSNHDDMAAAGIDIDDMKLIAAGSSPLTFDLACDIVDAFGVSFDFMLGREKKPTLGEESGLDDKDLEIISLLSSLSGPRRDEGLRYLRYLADHPASEGT